MTCSLGSLGYRVRLLSIADIPWYSVNVYLFSAAEISAGIICSCTPILAAFFRTTRPCKFKTRSLHYFNLPLFFSRGSRSFRRVFTSDRTASADKLRLNQPPEQESGNYVELEDGPYFVKPNKVAQASRGVEVFPMVRQNSPCNKDIKVHYDDQIRIDSNQKLPRFIQLWRVSGVSRFETLYFMS